jgi:FkbM family methyltransferase
MTTECDHQNNRLIFDIGMHKGFDTGFYLKKGFSVVGVEARRDLCAIVAVAEAQAIADGRLSIVEKALFLTADEERSFYVNPSKDDWGSLFLGTAEKGIAKAEKIYVRTTTLQELISRFGVPYYLKCDIEGGDYILVDQLARLNQLPSFVSIEVTRLGEIAKLFALGFDRFQLVNQQMNAWVACPSPSREGNYVKQRFNGEMSGLFGHELSADKWVEFDTAARLFLDWVDLGRRDKNLAIGWLDAHVTTAQVLQRDAHVWERPLCSDCPA